MTLWYDTRTNTLDSRVLISMPELCAKKLKTNHIQLPVAKLAAWRRRNHICNVKWNKGRRRDDWWRAWRSMTATRILNSDFIVVISCLSVLCSVVLVLLLFSTNNQWESVQSFFSCPSLPVQLYEALLALLHWLLRVISARFSGETTCVSKIRTSQLYE